MKFLHHCGSSKHSEFVVHTVAYRKWRRYMNFYEIEAEVEKDWLEEEMKAQRLHCGKTQVLARHLTAETDSDE